MINKEEIFHIALWMPSWIGDVVLSLPALKSLRIIYPDSRITAIVKPPTEQLLSGHPALDSILKFPSNKGDGFVSQFNYALGLRKYRFDLGIIFPNSFHSAFMLMLSGAKLRIGYRTDLRRVLLTHSIPVTRKEKISAHRVNYFHKILSPLNPGLVSDSYDPLWKTRIDKDFKDILLIMGIDKKDHIITIHPAASKSERTWHAERFGVLCQKLLKQYSVKIILLGTSKEKPLLEQIREFCPQENLSIVPELNLGEITQLLKMSRLFIGNDSGMLHLASLAGTPVVGIYGPGNPGTSGPFVDTSKREIVTVNYACSPCRQNFFKECKPSPNHKPYCIEDISVNDVLEAVHRIIKRLALC